jgi:hypothetical protein
MSGTVPNWIERLLGIDSGAGEGTLWNLQHSWIWPPWLTLLALALIGLLVIAIYLREGDQVGRRYKLLLAGLRLGVLGLVLLMIAQLAISLERTGLPYVAVLLDDSLSMTVVDPYDRELRQVIDARLKQAGFAEPSRWNLARTLLTENQGSLLTQLARRYRLRVYYVTGARPSPSIETDPLLREIRAMEPSGETTRLGAAVRAVLGELRGNPPAAIVLLTDGINTDGPSLADAAAEARRKGVPLFPIGLGDDKPIRQLRLGDLLVDDVVFAGDLVNFQFKLSGVGCEGQRVEVVLRQDARPEVLARLEATVGPDGQTQTLQLPLRVTAVGKFRYRVEVTPPEGLAGSGGLRQEREIEVRKAQIRVLLVQASPSFEYRYLRNLLARDETIELHTVLQDADPEYAQEDRAALRVFPVEREKLFAYDVVILGDVNPALLSQSSLQDLADFVTQKSKGGALALVAGPKYMPLAYRGTPLASLLPIDLATARYPEPDRALREGFVAQLTELGLAQPAMQLGDSPAQTQTIWKNLPPLYWMFEAADVRPGARVLAERPLAAGHGGHPLPLIVLQYVGAGRVLFSATDETWRWRRRVGDVLFARYWIQMIRSLARSTLSSGRGAELTADSRQYPLGRPVRLRVRFDDPRLAPPEDDGVTVVLEHTGHRTRRLGLERVAANRGVFEKTMEGLSAGQYHAWLAVPALEGQAPAVDFAVVAPHDELEQTRMDTAGLQRAADETKGRFYTFATADQLLAEMPEGRQVPMESLPPKSLWNKWPLLALLLGLLTTEWILRKRGGMV